MYLADPPKPIKLEGGILRNTLFHSFTNSINILQAHTMAQLAGQMLETHYTAQTWKRIFVLMPVTFWEAHSSITSQLHGLELHLKGVLLSKKVQFARDRPEASWSRVGYEPTSPEVYTSPQALCGFSLQWVLDIRCFFWYHFPVSLRELTVDPVWVSTTES